MPSWRPSRSEDFRHGPSARHRALSSVPGSFRSHRRSSDIRGWWIVAVNTDVSVVICAYDNARWRNFEETMRSLRRQTHRASETLVVVDHNPQFFGRARERFPQAKVVENVYPRGLAGARNTGVENASGAVVAFLDDDAFAAGDWLARLLDPYSNADVAGVGGSIEPVWASGRPKWFPPEFDWVVGCTYLGLPDTTHDVRNMIGCNMSFRRSVLESLGPFRLGYGCDETELCIRLCQRWPAMRLRYVPRAKVFHHIPEGRARFGYFMSRCYFEGGSKAVVSSLVGSKEGLSSERRYTRDVLPRGVLRGIADVALRADPHGLGRAGAIIAGVATAGAGYVAGRLTTERAARDRGWYGDWPPHRQRNHGPCDQPVPRDAGTGR